MIARERIRTLLQHNPLYYVDVETTGFSPAEIVEIAIVDKDRNVVFEKRFRPITPITASAQQVHGISAEMVAEEDSFVEWYGVIAPLLHQHSIFAFNAQFEMKALRDTCELHNLRVPQGSWNCAMLLAQQQLFLSRRPSLVTTALRLGLSMENIELHQAASDTLLLYDIVQQLALHH